ncbi:hypothetical protein CYMTET_18640 [Cymbomonas tetramitiformis]|uniref:EF-hand domain-containing protein n=1 Tax=Cymbomonas tetramitiformis TaxID=36881 RepID=A0AAE0G7P6_9CHLO|nr:hypothetical protein CYMTET_18640 [Cymbomonas tetramitiformis]
MRRLGGSDGTDAEAERVLWGDVMARLQMFAKEDTRRKQLLRDAAGTRLAAEEACELVREGRFICSTSESGRSASGEQGEGMVNSHDDVLAELIELFTEMDEDDDGLLTWREIWALLDRGGYHVSQGHRSDSRYVQVSVGELETGKLSVPVASTPGSGGW